MENIQCDNAPNGLIGLKLGRQTDNMTYDCIILDINLPLMDGLTLCKELRKNRIATPIIMLTARDTIDQKLEGFAIGADDYLCKPFDMRELVARIKSLAQRNRRVEELRCDDLVMDLKTCQVTRCGRMIALTQTEFRILRLLMTYSPNVVSRQNIIEEIWGEESPESDVLKVHIHNLRKSINLKNSRALLHTEIGKGYSIAVK